MKHTPLPWRVDYDHTKKQSPFTITRGDGPLEWEHLASVYLSEDAKFIVRACNNHYKLLNALQRIEKLGHGDGHGCGYTCAEIAKAAIKEALE